MQLLATRRKVMSLDVSSFSGVLAISLKGGTIQMHYFARK